MPYKDPNDPRRYEKNKEEIKNRLVDWKSNNIERMRELRKRWDCLLYTSDAADE